MNIRRKEIDKPDGGIRLLGIPTVLDRLIQQAIAQMLEQIWDPTFFALPNRYFFERGLFLPAQ
ncbi:hypothetical protein [Desulfosarcina ovata]|uniref:Reverse transcriptase domain-containing protein n=2 Tax=Desulfosarcina ovata TaxID=83564 RepID=A0A5K8AI37_9BACT|nr:hypothetical protein [Desulfosarcina ovata]BBO82709.1 hypothetical protein DSCO28_32750 [Desulfosarcina ovata subsp. sediminis]BBO92327.1 hypothetical protein DSCOOX_55070 [Desulfosarcina ovata subsp. ovata]